MSAPYDCPNPRCVDGNAYRAEVSRLQARWDARDKALRALIERWRTEERHTGDTAGAYAAGRIDCADELERAMGDDR